MPQKLDSQLIESLTQSAGLFGKQSFRLGDEELHVKVTGVGSGVEFGVPFREIESTGTRVFHVPWISLAFGVASIISLLGCVYVGMTSTRKNVEEQIAIVFIISLIVLAICCIHAWQNWVNVIAFRSSKGNIVIRPNRPDVPTVKAFVGELERRVHDSQNVERRVVRDVLAVLKEEGMLDEWQYRKARERFGVSRDDAM